MIKLLNPQTLEEDVNGLPYDVVMVGDSKSITAVGSALEISTFEETTLEDKINFLYYKGMGVI